MSSTHCLRPIVWTLFALGPLIVACGEGEEPPEEWGHAPAIEVSIQSLDWNGLEPDTCDREGLAGRPCLCADRPARFLVSATAGERYATCEDRAGNAACGYRNYGPGCPSTRWSLRPDRGVEVAIVSVTCDEGCTATSDADGVSVRRTEGARWGQLTVTARAPGYPDTTENVVFGFTEQCAADGGTDGETPEAGTVDLNGRSWSTTPLSP